jgi:hypothetical protein
MKRRNTAHQHTPEEERRIREAALDRTLAESFPASDPPSTVPNPDITRPLSPAANRRTAMSDGPSDRKVFAAALRRSSVICHLV